MHHCVFTNEYYLKADSLILSATIDGKRIETIEVSLKRMEVVQSLSLIHIFTRLFHLRNIVHRLLL